MPDTITVHPATIDWNCDDRPAWQAQHERYRQAQDIELAAAHVTPLDLDSLFEPEPDEPAPCAHCDGRGWFSATDSRRPWREVRQTCWECQ